jgi:hypothetical protein
MIPETPDRLQSTSIELEDSEIRVIDIGQGDTEHSTIVHVPQSLPSWAPNDPKSIGESQQYLRDFSRVVDRCGTVEDVVKAMLELHPDRDSARVVWHCAREAIKKREQG